MNDGPVAPPVQAPVDATSPARAIYAFPRNLVLAASAGTGKTHALVGVAVHLLMGACASPRGTERALRDPVLPGRLVATTFSRKAAGEIRARLQDELGWLASGDPRSAYQADLVAACAAADEAPFSDAELAVRAGRALHGIGRARIGTLHSLAASIVRDHALLLGLSQDFDLPDEEAARERAEEGIERVIERRAADPDVAALIQLAGSASALVDMVRRLLARIAEDGHDAVDVELAADDAAEMDATLRSVVDRARDLLGDAKLGEPARALVAAYDADPDGRGGGDLEDAMGALWGVPRTGKLSSAAAAFFELREAHTPTTSGARLRERGRALVRAWGARERLLPRSRALKELLVTCEAELAAANTRDSVLGFTDILRAARDVLRDNPGVAAEAGASFDALLVDEFQDTSGVQRDLVLLLWEHDRRGGQLRDAGRVPTPRDLRGDGLLVVGDRKQSIYGFRGADVAVFAELCVGLAGAPAREALAIPPGLVWEPETPSADFIPLRDNRRGEPELLEFANAMSRLSLVPQSTPPELYEITYSRETEDLRSPLTRTRAGADAESPPRARTHWLRVAVPPAKLTSSLLAEAEVIAARIASIVRGGELALRGAPARWRDVAILAPRHDMLSAAAYTLAQAGIPHVVAGMGFFGAAEVRDMIAMLGCLVDADDSLSRAEVLRGPWAGATDRALVGLTDPHGGLVDVAQFRSGARRFLIDVESRPAIEALADVVTTLRPIIGRIGPGAALREAVRALSFEETLTLLPRGAQRVANVQKLLAIADLATDATELLRRLRRAADAEQREGEAATFADEEDAVRLLTVHGSKGLAFPIVFLPEAGAVSGRTTFESILLQSGVAGRPSRLVLRLQDDIGSNHDPPSYTRAKRDALRRGAAERLRLRYVAITRASEAMYFVGDRAPPKGPMDTYDTSTASILARLSADEATLVAARFDVETGESLRRSPPRGEELAAEPLPTYRRLQLAPPREVVVSAESLRLAARCARRFQLDDASAGGRSRAARPRTVSQVTAWLATAGDWGARLAREQPRLLLSETLVFLDRDGAPPAVSVVGVVDVTVLWPDASVDLISFDGPSSDPDADGLYASVLSHAARGRRPDALPARVGLLGGVEKPTLEPVWHVARDLDWTRSMARAAVGRMLSVPTNDLAPRVPIAVCVQSACPHLAACYPHGDASSSSTRPPTTKQTSFDFFETDLRLGASRRKRPR